MKIFNSLGSNYNFSFVIKSFFSIGNKDAYKILLKKLEKEFTGDAYLFYKGRNAIEKGLRSLNLGPDDEVAINGFTCYAVYNAIESANLKPYLIDIDENDLNFSPEEFEKAAEKNQKIKAVIIQNTLGYPCEILKISNICKRNNIILIEDLAHSFGTKYSDKSNAGQVGDIAILSFSQDKIIDGISGGALIIRNPKYKNISVKLSEPKFSQIIKDRIYPLSTFIIRGSYGFYFGKIFHYVLKSLNLLSHPMDGNNKSRTISNWYSNMILDQMKNIDQELEHRKKIAHIYNNELPNKIKLKNTNLNIDHATNLRFPILINDRSDLIDFLKKKGIFVSDIWYDAPISPKRYMKKTSYNNECPISENVSERILNLPTHKNINENNAYYISFLINKWLK